MSIIDTLPLLEMLDSVSHPLNRGELRRRGIDDHIIDEAARLGHIKIYSNDDFRNGKQSLLATVVIADAGECILDDAL